MNPEQITRDAVRTIDELERKEINTIVRLLKVVEDDARAALDRIDFDDPSLPRAAHQTRVQAALNQSRAQQELLAFGRGPLADDMRRDIEAAYDDGIRTGREAIAATSVADDAFLKNVQEFGTRVELNFIRALTNTNLTNLDQVGVRGYQRLLEVLTVEAVKGNGPRAAARAVESAVGVTRSEAERITRTVLMDANNRARDATYDQAGVTLVRYDATNDSRTCGFCASRHGMVYQRGRAPRAPLHPNCRCVLLPYRENQTPSQRADDYYVRTRRDLQRRSEDLGHARQAATNPAPFERSDGRPAPKPVITPDGRTYR